MKRKAVHRQHMRTEGLIIINITMERYLLQNKVYI